MSALIGYCLSPLTTCLYLVIDYKIMFGLGETSDLAGCGGEDEKAFGKSAKVEASVFGAMFTTVDGRGDDWDSVACF